MIEDVAAAARHLDMVRLLTDSLATKRWYRDHGTRPDLTRVGGFMLAAPTDEVVLETLIVRDASASPETVYQVPLSYRSKLIDEGEAWLLGYVEVPGLGLRYVYDAVGDPAYARALVSLIVEGGQAKSISGDMEPAVGVPARGTPRSLTITESHAFSGEQSNSSIIVTVQVLAPGAKPVLQQLFVKVFRTLAAGENPDVELQTALALAGSTLVPAPLGALVGTWGTAAGEIARGHLGFAQEFLPDATDGWLVASASVAAGEDFTHRAHQLGEVTARLHRELALLFPTVVADHQAKTTQVALWRDRLNAALRSAPELVKLQSSIDAIFAAAQQVAWPPLQRIHGDFHLGQVLEVPYRDWIVLDFEGEPLRPVSERIQPDLAPRDVAGMLRSLDYAAGAYIQQAPETSAAALSWAEDAKKSFLDGYSSISKDPRKDEAGRVVLAALELDKALYEVEYEARYRPDWVSIPISAVKRLAALQT